MTEAQILPLCQLRFRRPYLYEECEIGARRLLKGPTPQTVR